MRSIRWVLPRGDIDKFQPEPWQFDFKEWDVSITKRFEFFGWEEVGDIIIISFIKQRDREGDDNKKQ